MRTVLVYFDTLRRDAIEPYNSEAVTPSFRRLAQKGAVFNQHYAGSMPCMPARRELHTGRYNFLHRSWGPLEPFDFSMPQRLKEAGIHSHLISDHYHYWEGGGATYHTRFSTWEAVRGQEGDPWVAEVGFKEFPETLGCPHRFMTDQYEINRRYMLEHGFFPQRETFTKGIEFLSRNAESDDWFLQIETFDPHEPFFSDEGATDPKIYDYDGPRFDWPAYGGVTENGEELDHVRRRYHELVRVCDRQLGRILDTFDRLDLWKDTALIVSTDHGFLLGEHGESGKVVQPFFSEVIRLPLFLYLPDSGGPTATSPGEAVDSLTQAVDLAPTILALHGVEALGDHFDGEALQPLLSHAQGGEGGRKYGLYGIFGAHVCVTDGRYTFFRAPRSEENQPLYEHTLMPWNMREPAPLADLDQSELVRLEGFAQGLPLLRYPGHAHSPKLLPWFEDYLFDLESDPDQAHNLLTDSPAAEALREDWCSILRREMQRAKAPESQYERLGI